MNFSPDTTATAALGLFWRISVDFRVFSYWESQCLQLHRWSPVPPGKCWLQQLLLERHPLLLVAIAGWRLHEAPQTWQPGTAAGTAMSPQVPLHACSHGRPHALPHRAQKVAMPLMLLFNLQQRPSGITDPLRNRA